MMFSAATSTISVRMMNITLRSTLSASKKVSLRWRQSVMMIGRPARVDQRADVVHLVGIVDEGLDDGDLVLLVEKGLRFPSGM